MSARGRRYRRMAFESLGGGHVELDPPHTLLATQKISQQISQGDAIKHSIHVLLSFRKDPQQYTVLDCLAAALLRQALIHGRFWSHGADDIAHADLRRKASQGIATALAAHGPREPGPCEPLKDFRQIALRHMLAAGNVTEEDKTAGFKACQCP